MSSYSTAPFRRSGSSGSMSSTTKTNSKTVLFDSKTLQGMLGLTPAGAGAGAGGGKPPKTKADRKALKKATMSRNREYNRMVESILLEETGQVMKSKKRKTKQNNNKSSTILTTAFNNRGNNHSTSIVSSQPVVVKESVVSYAGALGCRYDDINFLDLKYDNLKFQTNRIMAKLRHGYETIIQRDDNIMTVDDAVVLLSYAEVEMDSVVFDIGISKSLVDSSMHGDSDESINKVDPPSIVNDNDNDMNIKDISTVELERNLIDDTATAQDTMTTDTMPVDNIYFNVWMVHTAVAVRLRLAQDALAQERGIIVPSNSVVDSQSTIRNARNEELAESMGFEVLEKELQEGLETAYSQSLANFNFSTNGNTNPSGMLRSRSQPDPSTQSYADDTERLAPLRLKKLRKIEAMHETKSMGNFDAGFGRETPRCLRAGESQHENTGSFAAIEELRRELAVANQGLQHLDSMVAENIQWVSANCDVQGVLEKKGHTLSNRAVTQCRTMAAERLSDVIESYVTVALKRAFGRMKQAVKLSTIASTSKNYLRGKCIEMTVNNLSCALRRQYKKVFEPWVLRVRWETRWEQEAATVEMQRIARAFLAKCRIFRIICGLKSIIIQCCVRKYLAKCRIARVRRAREVFNAATNLKYFIKSRVMIRLAKARVQAKREARAALRIQCAFRGFQGREKVRAIRAHIVLRHFSATQIQKIYRSKIQCYYAVLERKKYLQDRRIEAEREAMRVEALREDAATKIQGQARRLIAIRRVKEKRREKLLNDSAKVLQRYFKRRVSTRADRDSIKVRRLRHYAAIKIQSILRMRLGQKKMDRRRADHARGIPLFTPSYDEDDPDVVDAVIKIQSVARGKLARQKASNKKDGKKKNRLRLMGKRKSSDKNEDPPKSASRGFSMRNMLSRTPSQSVENTQKSRPKSASSSADNSLRKSYKGDVAKGGANNSRPPSAEKSAGKLSRPASGQQSKGVSRPNSSSQRSKSPAPGPSSGASFRSMLSRGLSSLPTSTREKDIKEENALQHEDDLDREVEDINAGKQSRPESAEKSGRKSLSRPASGQQTKGVSRPNSSSQRSKAKSPSDSARVLSARSSRAASRSSSAVGSAREPEPEPEVDQDSPPTVEMTSLPLQPKTPSRPVEELGTTMQEDDVDDTEGIVANNESKSRPTSGKSSRPSSRPSSGGKPASRPNSAVKSVPPPQLQDTSDDMDNVEKVEESDFDQNLLEEDRQLASKEVGLENVQEHEDEDLDEDIFDDEKNNDDVIKTQNAPNDSIKESSPPPEEEKRGRPFSKSSSMLDKSPSFMRQASSKIFGRSVSTPDDGKRSKSKSPSRAQSPLLKMKSMLSFRSPSIRNRPRSTYKPKIRTLIPRDDDDAAIRIQSIVRQRLGYLKLKAKKKEVRNLQKKAGLIVLWAIVTIQRVIRGRIGRWRWARIHKEHRDKLQKDENDRIWRELEEEEVREKKEAAEKQRLAEELEEQNNAKWSQYGKPRPEKKDGVVDSPTTDPRDRVLPPPTTAPPPLHATQPLQHDSKVSELDERMRRLEEMEKTMIEKEERMIQAAKKAEEKAAEMQRAIEAMEKRAAEEEAEKQVRRSMMELAAGPMSSMGSQLSTGPVRSSRPSARNGPMASSRSKADGPMSSRPPPTARSAKDGTPRPTEVLKVHVQGVEWVQLWDPDESAWYWYCESTGAAQWDQPNEYGYESAGAMTDYSTENDGWNTEGAGSEWQEYWDEQAQAKYWYNTTTGEASWTPPETDAGSVGTGSSFQGPAGDDWVSYIDDATSEEYWYNTKTGETSWSN